LVNSLGKEERMNRGKKLALKYALNLQRFADPFDNINKTTDDGMKGDQKEYYDAELLRNTTPGLVYAQFGKKTPLPKGNGKTVRWRRLKSYAPATEPLQEGITPAGKKMQWETITATIEQYGDYTPITDRVQTESMDPQVIELTREHGNQGSLTLDTVTREELMSDEDVVNVIFPPKEDGTAVYSRDSLDKTCNITPRLISMCKTILKRNNAKTYGKDYIAIIHPDLEHDLTNHPKFIDVVEYGDPTRIYKGEIGTLYGVRFMSTSQCKIWKDETCPKQKDSDEYLPVYGVIFFGDDAYGTVDIDSNSMEMIINQVGSSGAADPLKQRGSIGWKNNGYAAKVLNGLHMVRAEVCSADFSDIAESN
jgi:N4-gp56 family major capsid protein